MADDSAPEEVENDPMEPETKYNPDQLRTAAIQQHQANNWSKVNWVPQKQVNGGHIVADAVAQIGQPHKWGGNQPGGFDSQGLAKYAYHQNGIPMSQLIHNQMQHGDPVEPSELQPGDLVFVSTNSPQMPDRTGVYAGSGIMVHAAPGTGVIASRISHIGKIAGGVHLKSVVRTSTPKPQPVPKGLYETDDVMPHNRLSPALKESTNNVKGVH